MTEVRLYHGVIGVERFIAKLLAGKLLPEKQSVLIQTASKADAQRLDDHLWSLPSEDSFIPHCLAGDPVANRTPVVITYPQAPNEELRDVMVNLVPKLPVDAASHHHLISVLNELIDAYPEFDEELNSLSEKGYVVKRFDQSRRK